MTTYFKDSQNRPFYDPSAQVVEKFNLTQITEEEFNSIVEELNKPVPPSAKGIRDEALRTLTHDFGDGRVIQVRPADFANDELNIRNAIERMQRLGLTQQPWVMVDNTSHMVTVAELETAIASGQDQGAAIWQTYIEAIS